MEEQSKKPTYKYCIVPKCKNTIRNAPDKLFFHVPRGADVRRKWCKIMKRDMVSPSTCLYCCEDHFDVEEDTDNYMEYKIMYLQEKRNCTLRLKKGIVPHKFQCRKDTKTQPASRKKGSLKRKPLEAIADVPTAPPAKLSAGPVQAEIKVCRGCLAMDVKMFDMKDFELTEMFQNVTGISVSDNTEIIHHRVCWECAARLTAAATFRDKALLSDALLKDIAHMKKSDIATLKKNYSMLKSRLNVFTALTFSDIKCEETDKKTFLVSNDEEVSKEIKTEIMNQEDIEFEEHEPWIDVPVKLEMESNPVAENNIKGDAFKTQTHPNDDCTCKEDIGSDKTNIATLEKNHSILSTRLTDLTEFTCKEIIIGNRDKETASNDQRALDDTIVKQEREETDFEENETWEDISVKIQIESDTTARNNTKSDAFTEVTRLNNDSTSKEDSGLDLRTIELQNYFEEDAKMSYDPVINDDSNTNVNITVVNDKEIKSKLNIISITEDEISSDEDTQYLAELVSVKKV